MSLRSSLVAGAACLVIAAPALAQTPVQRPPLPAGQLQTLPLTQLDERLLAADLDNRTFTLTFAKPVPIKDLLLLLVRGTGLSIIPNPGISGSFIGELKNVTVRRALGLILPPLGLDYAVDGGFISVFRREPETRLFDVNYIATERTSTAEVGVDAGAHGVGSVARVSSTTSGDLFAELAKGIQALVSEHATFNVDRKAGLLQVTDLPERLDRVAVYLDTVHQHVHRQVQIDARVIEVELNDANAQTLDWAGLTQSGRVSNVATFLAALAVQGKVSTLASPRLVALNNEPAIVRTEGLAISVTPQISPDGIIMMSLSPIVTVPTVSEADMLARVGNGETIVVAGFGREREIRERRNVGLRGGWFGRSTVVTQKRAELLILLTPKILYSTAD